MGNSCCCEESRESAVLPNLTHVMVEETEDPLQAPEEDTEVPPAPLEIEQEPEAEADVVVKKVGVVEPDASTFIIDVEVSGRKLGFGIGHRSGLAAVEVVKLHDDGVIADWNKSHYPEKQVVVGSKIVALNGTPIVEKDREAMLADIARAVQAPRVRMEVLAP
mmetsp:Transcript_3097/g.7900  ORF Transcript_3097/g.7900 Transcript_3097/m.7900 type:complete len:163 (+) Transcript_3097:66-554(+)